MIGILIPSLNPNDKLIRLIKDLKKAKVSNIFIVNDGSSLEYDKYYDECKKLGCVIFKHDVNKGKGVALKTGISSISKKYPKITGVVTADSDGQHSTKDIIRVMKELEKKDCVVLGTRNLTDKKVPLRSKIGNYFSIMYFKITTGIYLKDTQTGLRGIPKRYFNYSLNIEGDRFEYEMRFLEKMKDENIEFCTIDIDTIYEEDRTTHFRFIKDSIIIYKTLIRNIFVALSSAFIDIGLFYLMTNALATFIASIIARIVSGIYNFSLSKIWTFEKDKSNHGKEEFVKYLVLFFIQMIVSSLLISIVQSVLDLEIGIIIFKALIDFVIFGVNFVVMKRWVFKK